MVHIEHYDLRLTADPARVVLRPFHIAPEPRDLHAAQSSRVLRIIDSVLQLSAAECHEELSTVKSDFSDRHWQTKRIFEARFDRIAKDFGVSSSISEAHRELLGAYFCHEYSYTAAAVMNPSVVAHFDQSGLSPGHLRFIMSLRTVGEGHISSITFREGILGPNGALTLWPQPEITLAAECTDADTDGEVEAVRPTEVPLSGAVIFPCTRAQRNGLEDLRLVRFQDGDGEARYYGSYTAYSGVDIRSELLSTDRFDRFKLTPMTGGASRNKGMALFPRRVDGGYMMIGRQDGESIFLLRSDSLTHWDGGEKIISPKLPWELVQMGNCGSPIELEEGWLLLTHGVGAVRKYSVGAALLDKHDPSKVLGRLEKPLLTPSEETREGYVPNVVYTCGALRHGDELFLPFGVADSSVGFARVSLPSLLAEMK